MKLGAWPGRRGHPGSGSCWERPALRWSRTGPLAVASEHLWAGGERQMDETRDLSVQELLAAEMILNVELNNASLPTVPCLSRERPNRRVLCII